MCVEGEQLVEIEPLGSVECGRVSIEREGRSKDVRCDVRWMGTGGWLTQELMRCIAICLERNEAVFARTRLCERWQ